MQASGTDFDHLIRNYLTTSSEKIDETIINERVGETWKDIKKERVDPMKFLERADIMQKRLIRIVENFGSNRIAYAGPECGLKSFPTYECALECLSRVAEATRTATT